MITTTLALFGALLVAATCRALWIGVRTALGSRRPPEAWLERNGFERDEQGRWRRGRLTVEHGRHGWAVWRVGDWFGVESHPCEAVHHALTTERSWMRSVLDGLR